MEARRQNDFIERLSILLVVGAYLGGFIVLLDIKLILPWITLGSGFSPDVKGVVLQSMLITGFAAVVGFWLGTTKQGQDQAQSVNKIAEASAPTTAAAVAATVAAKTAEATPGPAIPLVPVGISPAAPIDQPKGDSPK